MLHGRLGARWSVAALALVFQASERRAAHTTYHYRHQRLPASAACCLPPAACCLLPARRCNHSHCGVLSYCHQTVENSSGPLGRLLNTALLTFRADNTFISLGSYQLSADTGRPYRAVASSERRRRRRADELCVRCCNSDAKG